MATATANGASREVSERSSWRAVAVPSEHGGWGLTLEPVLLGLIVAWSLGGVLLGLGAFTAFLIRTPLKTVVVDRRRHHWRERTQVAAWFVVGEAVVLASVAAIATVAAGWAWLVPVGITAPLVAVESWFDVRSRGRRLVPELCGAVGIAAVVAVIVIAGGRDASLAAGLWLVLSARAIGAIPFVRAQVGRLRRGAAPTWHSDVAQVLAVGVGVAAALVDHRVVAGLVAVALLALVQTAWVRSTPVPAKVLGLRQMGLGLALVLVTATGVLV